MVSICASMSARIPPKPEREDYESSVDLLARARSGEKEALERLCERYRPVLRRWAHGRLPQWARSFIDTDDMVQDTLMQTVRRIEAFEPRHDGALQAYLREAVQNKLRDEIRRHRREPGRAPLDSGAADDAPSPLEQTLGSQNLERYEAALARVSPEDKELIVLRIEMGMSYDELAAAAGKPSANAARMGVMRALLRLGAELGHER